jgi:hypothetical protein
VTPGPEPVEPTELVAGRWQLRPWPAADADLDAVLVERYSDPVRRAAERTARLDGWRRGDLLGFAVRDITTGACSAEVVVAIDREGARVEAWARPSAAPALSRADLEAPTAAVVRWVHGALGADVLG